MHFLLECECYATHRKELFATINEKINGNNIQLRNKKERFINLLTNIHIIPLTAHYLVTHEMIYWKIILKNDKEKLGDNYYFLCE